MYFFDWYLQNSKKYSSFLINRQIKDLIPKRDMPITARIYIYRFHILDLPTVARQTTLVLNLNLRLGRTVTVNGLAISQDSLNTSDRSTVF